MTDLHTKAMLAQEFARLALYSLDRPDDEALAERVRVAEERVRLMLLQTTDPLPIERR